MHQTSSRRLPLLAAALLAFALALLAPVGARADDRSFARTAIEHANHLATAQTAARRAVARVDAKGRAALPQARRKVREVRGQVTLMVRAVDGETTSTPVGETTKRDLLRLLATVKKGYGTLDLALAAHKRGDRRGVGILLRRATRQLSGTGAEAERIARDLHALAI